MMFRYSVIEDPEKWLTVTDAAELGPYWTPEWASMWTTEQTALIVTDTALAVVIAGEVVRSPSGDTGIAAYDQDGIDQVLEVAARFGDPLGIRLDPLSPNPCTVVVAHPQAVVMNTKGWAECDMSTQHRRHVRRSRDVYDSLVTSTPSDEVVGQFVRAYADTEQRRGFDVPLNEGHVERLFSRSDAVLSAAMDGSNLAAGVVYVRRKSVGAYHWGATANEYVGKAAPSKLAMVNALNWCQTDTIVLGPGAEDGDGLERYKTGFGLCRHRLTRQGIVGRRSPWRNVKA